MIVEVTDARILKFLEMRFQAADVSATEALETLVLAINHLQPIPELVEMAKVSSRKRRNCPMHTKAFVQIMSKCLCLSFPDVPEYALY